MDWCLWDVASFSTAAAVHELFQNRSGSDSNNPKHKTNMRGSGSLPVNEKFTIRKIGLQFDNQVALADVFALTDSAYVEIVVSDRIVCELPLIAIVDRNSYNGAIELASAAAQAAIGRPGDGYGFREPIELSGGDSFSVRITQTTVLSAAEDVRVNLYGDLVTG